MKTKCLILSLAMLFAVAADAHTLRSKAARLAFVKANACPSTGLHKAP